MLNPGSLFTTKERNKQKSVKKQISFVSLFNWLNKYKEIKTCSGFDSAAFHEEFQLGKERSSDQSLQSERRRRSSSVNIFNLDSNIVRKRKGMFGIQFRYAYELQVPILLKVEPMNSQPAVENHFGRCLFFAFTKIKW